MPIMERCTAKKYLTVTEYGKAYSSCEGGLACRIDLQTLSEEGFESLWHSPSNLKTLEGTLSNHKGSHISTPARVLALYHTETHQCNPTIY